MVVLPIPVGPVINTRPLGSRVSSSMIGGSPSSSFVADDRFAQPDGHFRAAGVQINAGAKASQPGPMPRDRQPPLAGKNLPLPFVDHFVQQRMQHFGAERFSFAGANFAVDAKDRSQPLQSGGCRWPSICEHP